MRVDTPPFKDEYEEAKWWFENQDSVADAYDREHPLPANMELVDLLVDKDDAEFAFGEAQKRSISREQYLREVLREALKLRRAT